MFDVMDRIGEEIKEAEAELEQAMKTKESSMRVCDEIEAKQQDIRQTERSSGDERMETSEGDFITEGSAGTRG